MDDFGLGLDMDSGCSMHQKKDDVGTGRLYIREDTPKEAVKPDERVEHKWGRGPPYGHAHGHHKRRGSGVSLGIGGVDLHIRHTGDTDGDSDSDGDKKVGNPEDEGFLTAAVGDDDSEEELLEEDEGDADADIVDNSIAGLSARMAQDLARLNAIVTASNPKAPREAKVTAMAAAETGAGGEAMTPAMTSAIFSGLLQGVVRGSQANPDFANAAPQLRQQARMLAATGAAPTMASVNQESAEDMEEVYGADIETEPTIIHTVPKPGQMGRGVAGQVPKAALYGQLTTDGIVATGQTVTSTATALTGTVAALGTVANSPGAMQASQDLQKAASSLFSGLGSAGRGVSGGTRSAFRNLKKKKKDLVESDDYKDAKKKAKKQKDELSEKAKKKKDKVSKSTKTKKDSASASAKKKKDKISKSAKTKKASATASAKKKASGAKARVKKLRKKKRGKRTRAEFIGDGYDPIHTADEHHAEYFSSAAYDLGEMMVVDELVDAAYDAYIGATPEMPHGATSVGPAVAFMDAEAKRNAAHKKMLEEAEVALVQTDAGTVVNAGTMALIDAEATMAAAKAADVSVQTGDMKQGILGGFTDYLKGMVSGDGALMKTLSNMGSGIWESGGAALQYVRRGVSVYWEKMIRDWIPWLKENLGPMADSFMNETLPALVASVPEYLEMFGNTLGDVIKIVLKVVDVVADLIAVDFDAVNNLGGRHLTARMKMASIITHPDFQAAANGEAETYLHPEGHVLISDQAADLHDVFAGNAYEVSEEELDKKIADLDVGFSLFGGGKKKKAEEAVSVQVRNPHGRVEAVALKEMFDKIAKSEDNFLRDDDSLAAYAEEMAKNITVRLLRIENLVLHREMMRSMIQFLIYIVNDIGDLNTAKGGRLFENLARDFLSSSFRGIAKFQQQRDQVESLKKQAAIAAERARLQQQLDILGADEFSGGIFDSVKGLFGGGGKKKKKGGEPQQLSPAIQAQIQKRIAEQEAALNDPAQVRSSIILRASQELLAMAWDDATSRDMRVFEFINKLMNALTGGNYQGGDINEKERLVAGLKIFSITLIHLMNSPNDDWTDVYLSIMAQFLNAPIFNVSESIAELRKYTKGIGLKTEENDFEIEQERLKLSRTERKMPAGGVATDEGASEDGDESLFSDLDTETEFMGHEARRAGLEPHHIGLALDALKNANIPTGSHIHVLGDPFAETIVVAPPGARRGVTLTNDRVDMPSAGEFVPAHGAVLRELATESRHGVMSVRGKPYNRNGSPFKNNSKLFFYELSN